MDKNESKKDNWFVKALCNKWNCAAFYLVLGGITSLPFAGAITLFSKTEFIPAFELVYLCLGAPFAVAAIIHALLPNAENFEFGLACGFYYGGAALKYGLKLWPTAICFVISFLVCWIVYLYKTRELKEEYKNDNTRTTKT